MGGAHGKTKSRKPVPEESCCVCFEVGKKGLHCASGHLLCSECISPYAETIFRDVGVLRDCGFCVPCPAREEASVRCSAPAYDSHALRRFLGEAALDLYLDGLLSVCRQREGGREERTDATARQQLLESLNLKCPNPRCAAILDPSPDGCAAVRCAGCGTYICFLCFQSCSSSSAAHKHVAACEHSPKPGGLFIRDYEV
ncbi:hypothetical protein B484DRAFT_390705 [Ochromonadaceae sp. CCMP2298]|nr:hypothetical protein B484DRAFT_390705 [Ochromonadaceae sp. CCMP2298]